MFRQVISVLVAVLLISTGCSGNSSSDTPSTNNSLNSSSNNQNNSSTNNSLNSSSNSSQNNLNDPGTCDTDDLAEQRQCTPGYKCTVTRLSPLEVQCVEEGLLSFYDACTPVLDSAANQDNCPKGSVCAQYGEGYVCLPFCDAAGEPCPQGGFCLEGNHLGSTDIQVCSPPVQCNPFSSSGCAQGQTCYLLADYGNMTVCSPTAGTGQQGERCENAMDCAPGYTCYAGSGEKRCAMLCTDTSQCSRFGDTFSCRFLDEDNTTGVCY